MHFSTIITIRSLKSLLELTCSYFLLSLKSEPLKMQILQFACRSLLFFLNRSLAPEIRVRLRALERRAQLWLVYQITGVV